MNIGPTLVPSQHVWPLKIASTFNAGNLVMQATVWGWNPLDWLTVGCLFTTLSFGEFLRRRKERDEESKVDAVRVLEVALEQSRRELEAERRRSKIYFQSDYSYSRKRYKW